MEGDYIRYNHVGSICGAVRVSIERLCSHFQLCKPPTEGLMGTLDFNSPGIRIWFYRSQLERLLQNFILISQPALSLNDNLSIVAL